MAYDNTIRYQHRHQSPVTKTDAACLTQPMKTSKTEQLIEKPKRANVYFSRDSA